MAEGKGAGNKFLSLVGLGVILFACFYDKIKGAELTILGPKSFAVIIIGVVIVLVGLFCPLCGCSSGDEKSCDR